MNAEKLSMEFLKAYDEYADALFRHCYFRLSDRDLAQDVVQETFTRTWNYLVSGHHVDNFKAFLYRTAGNLIVDEYKKRKAVSLEQLVDEGFQPEATEENRDDILDAQQLVRCLKRLEEPYRSALTMRFLDGFSPKEIAQMVNETANVISVRINRGLEKLRHLFPSL